MAFFHCGLTVSDMMAGFGVLSVDMSGWSLLSSRNVSSRVNDSMMMVLSW